VIVVGGRTRYGGPAAFVSISLRMDVPAGGRDDILRAMNMQLQNRLEIWIYLPYNSLQSLGQH
jgi:hypothetical protein